MHTEENREDPQKGGLMPLSSAEQAWKEIQF